MSLSRKAQYKINKFKSLSSPKPAPLLQVGKAFAFKSKITFFAISAASWTMCGAYAYYVWTHKEPKEISDNPKSQLAVKEEEVNVKQNIQPKFAKYKSKLFEKNDEPVEYYVSNNPKVVQNDELKRFEVEYSSMFFDFVRVIEFDEVRRNENGEFVFNKEGYPIVRKTAFQQFIYDDYQRFMRFIHFFTRWFD